MKRKLEPLFTFPVKRVYSTNIRVTSNSLSLIFLEFYKGVRGCCVLFCAPRRLKRAFHDFDRYVAKFFQIVDFSAIDMIFVYLEG